MTQKIARFILDRIEEDRGLARSAVCGCGGPVCSPELGWYRRGELEERFHDAANRRGVVGFISEFCPARVLAECDAKERLVALHDDVALLHYRGGCRLGSCETLRILALPYARHPDYRNKWRP